jgi:hypothetical protein
MSTNAKELNPRSWIIQSGLWSTCIRCGVQQHDRGEEDFIKAHQGCVHSFPEKDASLVARMAGNILSGTARTSNFSDAERAVALACAVLRAVGR